MGNPSDVNDKHYDGDVKRSVILFGKSKRRPKKKEDMIWYDEKAEKSHEQICEHLCFENVYQFRIALRQLHVVQLRNFTY